MAFTQHQRGGIPYVKAFIFNFLQNTVSFIFDLELCRSLILILESTFMELKFFVIGL